MCSMTFSKILLSSRGMGIGSRCGAEHMVLSGYSLLSTPLHDLARSLSSWVSVILKAAISSIQKIGEASARHAQTLLHIAGTALRD